MKKPKRADLYPNANARNDTSDSPAECYYNQRPGQTAFFRVKTEIDRQTEVQKADADA